MGNQHTDSYSPKEDKILKGWEDPSMTIDALMLLLPKRTYSSIRQRLRRLRLFHGKNSSLKSQMEVIGLKRPKTKFRVRSKKLTKVFMFADTHYPFQDDKVMELLYKFIADLKPDFVVIGGDILDFPQLSKFRKQPSSSHTLQKDMNLVFNMLERIRETLPKAKIIFIEGNHEFRWRSYLMDNAPLFYDLPSTSLPKALYLENLDVLYVPCPPELTSFGHNYIEIGGYFIGHFNKALKNACYTGRMLRDELGVDVIQFHGHKIGTSHRTYLDGVRVGIEVGCTCKLNPSFIRNPDWQHGFGVLYLQGKKSSFYNIVIRDYSFIFNGKAYAVKHTKG